MRVLQACAEIYPLLKTGGLADVAGALPSALRAQGADVRPLLPGFPSILDGLAAPAQVAEWVTPFDPAPVRLLYGALAGCDCSGYVIDAPQFYRRTGGPYADVDQQAYPDNHRRFALLGWVAAQLAQDLDPHWRPDVVHAHDWHAALAPAYLHAEGQRVGRRLAASVFTVHNLAYQGVFAAHHFGELALPDRYFAVHGLEFHGQLSFMKGGLYYADRLTTVSPTYADEIQGAEQGCGLDGLLRDRAASLSGVLNGVDDAIWNPAQDPLIPHRYDPRRLIGKARSKAALQAELGLAEDADAPLFCVVSRLAEQKGLHLVLQALDTVTARGGQFALLGSGDAGMEAAFRTAAQAQPQAVAVKIGYDEAFAHRLIAGSDLILVPSRFEPCGLTQLYGLRYGTVPLVRRVGGLADTVIDTTLETLDSEATGFVFDDFSVDALAGAIRRAIALWRRPGKKRADWQLLQRRGMAERHDWALAAEQYMGVYGQALT
jgi:starch synthase